MLYFKQELTLLDKSEKKTRMLLCYNLVKILSENIFKVDIQEIFFIYLFAALFTFSSRSINQLQEPFSSLWSFIILYFGVPLSCRIYILPKTQYSIDET